MAIQEELTTKIEKLKKQVQKATEKSSDVRGDTRLRSLRKDLKRAQRRLYLVKIKADPSLKRKKAED